MKNETNLSRKLRQNSTIPELKLWNKLRDRRMFGYKFRRQFPVGNYIVDFVCKEKMLVIELDGGQHNEDDSIIYDPERTNFLESKGYRVLRFWNTQILKDLDNVLESIRIYLQ